MDGQLAMRLVLALISISLPCFSQTVVGIIGGAASASSGYAVDGFIDFESGANGDAISTSNIDNHGPSWCTFSLQTGGAGGIFQISTTGAQTLPGSVNVGGTVYSGTPSTRSVKYDPNGTTNTLWMQCAISPTQDNLSAGAYYMTTSTTQAPLSIIWGITDGLGGDYVVTHWINNGSTVGVHITAADTCSADPIPITANQAYYLTIVYQRTGLHQLYVFDPVTWTLTGWCTIASSSNTPAALFNFGRFGVDAQAGVGQWYWDDYLLDAKKAKFPLTPHAVYVNAPTLSVSGGTYNSSQSVTISDLTPSAALVYCIDFTGTCTPGTSYSGAITVSQTEHVRTIGTRSGWGDSAVTDAAYVIQTGTPTDSPGAGTYSSAQTVTLSDATGGAYICYTTDGSTPAGTASICTNGTHYTAGFLVSSTTTVKAVANYSLFDQSNILTSVYTIQTLPSLTANTCSNNGFASSLTCAYSSVTVGNILYITGVGAATLSVSGCGITWTSDTGGGAIQSTGTVTSTGACTVTLSGGSTSGMSVSGVEIQHASGVDVRGTPTSQGFIGANTSFNCPAVTTTANGDLVLCGLVDTSGNSGTYTAGSGYSLAVASGGSKVSGIEDGTKASAGAVTPTAKYSVGTNITTGTVAVNP